MDATPDLKRLAPVENLAIDVISYAHGSVTPTLTNLYSKGKESFLKVYKIYSIIITGAFLSSSSSSLVNENFFSSFSRRTNERIRWFWVRTLLMMHLCRSISDRSRTRDEFLIPLKAARKFRKFFPFFFDEPNRRRQVVAIWRSRQKF
jgi:hypothetical protein